MFIYPFWTVYKQTKRK